MNHRYYNFKLALGSSFDAWIACCPSLFAGVTHSQGDNDGYHDEAGSELKKGKGCWLFIRVKVHLLLMGNNVIGTNFSGGGGGALKCNVIVGWTEEGSCFILTPFFQLHSC